MFRFQHSSVSGFPLRCLNSRIPCASSCLAPPPTGRAVFPHPAVPSTLGSRHARVAAPLGLVTKLPSQTGKFQRRSLPRIVPVGLSSVGCRVIRSRGWLIHPQAVLPSSYVSMSMVGPLRSTGITQRRHYYEPRRLPIRAKTAVMDSHVLLRPSEFTTGRLALSGLPSSWHNCRRPPPPITPDRPTAADACCFTIGSRLRHSWKVGHGQSLTRPKRVHACALRLTSLPTPELHRSDYSSRCPGGYMINRQFTWQTPFSLQVVPSFAWRTRMNTIDMILLKRLNPVSHSA